MKTPGRDRRFAQLHVEVLEDRCLLSTTIAPGPNVNISRKASSQVEGAIAINPTNPANLAAFAIDYSVAAGVLAAYSTDAGQTWTRRVIGTGNGGDGLPAANGDVSAAFDRFGNLFLSYMSVGNSASVDVLLSTNGGQTFSSLAVLNGPGGNADQPTITTGPGSAGFASSVWETWKDSSGQVVAAGAGVSGLGSVTGFSTPETAPGSNGGNFGDIAIGPSGQVLITYQKPTTGNGPATVFVNIDADGLGSGGFGSAIIATTSKLAVRFIPAQSSRGIDTEANLAWDVSGGARNGRVYLVYTDAPTTSSTDSNIFVRFSDNAGASWSAPVQVNDPSTFSQFNPAIGVDQTTGNLAVAWLDARNDTNDGTPNDDSSVFATVSTDGGQSFLPNVAVSTGASNPSTTDSGIDLGDYNRLSFSNGVFYPVWADNSSALPNNPDRPNLDLATAAVTVTTTVPPPPTKQTPGTFDPATAMWYLRNENSSGPPDAGQFVYGAPNWIPIVGDWTGSGRDGIGAFDPATATWYLRNEDSAGPPDAGKFVYGLPGWVPVVGDWNNTGHDGIGVFDPSTATWYLRNEVSAGGFDAGSFRYGAPNWKPVAGDWTGTGHSGIGAFDPNTGMWYLRNAVNAGAADAGEFAYGLPGWKPVVGDWNNSGRAGVGAVNPDNATWYLRNQAGPGAANAGGFAYGAANWVPVAGSYSILNLRAAGGEKLGASSVHVLADNQLQEIVWAALTLIRNSGASSPLIQNLAAAHYDVAALPSGVLGTADVVGRNITISSDAAGYGWFVDSAPPQNEEFRAGRAQGSSPAATGMDLLTAVLHEMGHLAGASDLDSIGRAGNFMDEFSTPGTRNTQALDRVFGTGL